MSDAPLTNPRESAPLPPKPQRLGDVLREAREDKGLDINDVARITHVRKEYLRALDEGRYGDLPEEVYTRNFIKLYAQAVGLDDVRLLERYSRERELASPVNDAPRPITPPLTRVRASRPDKPGRRGATGARASSPYFLAWCSSGCSSGWRSGAITNSFSPRTRGSPGPLERTRRVTGVQTETETPGAETGLAEAEVDETDPIRAAAGAASSQASVQDAPVTSAGARLRRTRFF